MKTNSAIAAVIALVVMFVAGACNPAPEGVLSPEDMAQLLADIHTGESVGEMERREFSSDSMRRVLRQSVLAAHGLSSEEFDSSLMWYGKHIDIYSKVYDRVTEILEDRITRLENEGVYNSNDDSRASLGSIEYDGDSVDVWTGQRSVMMTAAGPSTIIPFQLVNDQNWARGDRYCLQLSTHGLQGTMQLSMAVEYYDGSVDYASKTVTGNNLKELKIPVDSAKNAHYVYGTISVNPKGDSRVFVDSITLYRTRLAPYNRNEFFMVKHLKNARP
ncbi:MAG: DUF4296 domain-containing protein [Muribaculaceae bacterium]|nr:DUF4296 domain-containing protein [Muribaculaceae bacterium]